MLCIKIPVYYKVKAGQTLRCVAEAFSVPETRVVYDNSLTGEVHEGQLLRLPREKGNLYTVRAETPKSFFAAAARITGAKTARTHSIPA